jgi:hypothetical protein
MMLLFFPRKDHQGLSVLINGTFTGAVTRSGCGCRLVGKMAVVTGGIVRQQEIGLGPGELSLPLLRQPPRPIALQRAASKHTPFTTTAPETPPNCPLATPRVKPCYAAQPTNPAPHLDNPPAAVGKRMRLRLLLLARRLRRAPIPPSALPACSTPGSMSASCHPSPRTQGLLCPRI